MTSCQFNKGALLFVRLEHAIDDEYSARGKPNGSRFQPKKLTIDTHAYENVAHIDNCHGNFHPIFSFGDTNDKNKFAAILSLAARITESFSSFAARAHLVEHVET